MTVIGLTGGFGTGKTFVASIFKGCGARVVDADRLAHKAILKGKDAYKKIVKLCGRDILDKKGQINRRKLGELVFCDKTLIRKINSIIHPAVISDIKKEIAAGKKDKAKRALVIDAPLLIEAGLDKLVDKIVVVKCSKRRQITRCQEKFRLPRRQILQRIGSQMPLEKKIRMADFLIDNSRTRSGTIKQAKRVWEEILWR